MKKISLYDFGKYLKECGRQKGTLNFAGDMLPMSGPRKYPSAWFASGEGDSVSFGVFYSFFKDPRANTGSTRPLHGTIVTGKITTIKGRVKIGFFGRPKVWATDYTSNFLLPGSEEYSDYIRKYGIRELL